MLEYVKTKPLSYVSAGFWTKKTPVSCLKSNIKSGMTLHTVLMTFQQFFLLKIMAINKTPLW